MVEHFAYYISLLVFLSAGLCFCFYQFGASKYPNPATLSPLGKKLMHYLIEAELPYEDFVNRVNLDNIDKIITGRARCTVDDINRIKSVLCLTDEAYNDLKVYALASKTQFYINTNKTNRNHCEKCWD